MRSASPGPRVTDIRHIIGLQVDLSEPVLVTAEGLQKLKHDLEPWRESLVTTLLVGGDAATLRTAAEVVLG